MLVADNKQQYFCKQWPNCTLCNIKLTIFFLGSV